MDKTNLVKRERKSSRTYEERKAEKIMGLGGERGYEKERLVHQ